MSVVCKFYIIIAFKHCSCIADNPPTGVLIKATSNMHPLLFFLLIPLYQIRFLFLSQSSETATSFRKLLFRYMQSVPTSITRVYRRLLYFFMGEIFTKCKRGYVDTLNKSRGAKTWHRESVTTYRTIYISILYDGYIRVYEFTRVKNILKTSRI